MPRGREGTGVHACVLNFPSLRSARQSAERPAANGVSTPVLFVIALLMKPEAPSNSHCADGESHTFTAAAVTLTRSIPVLMAAVPRQ
jgi:hypothetical protein